MLLYFQSSSCTAAELHLTVMWLWTTTRNTLLQRISDKKHFFSCLFIVSNKLVINTTASPFHSSWDKKKPKQVKFYYILHVLIFKLPLFQASLSSSFLFPSHFSVMCWLFPTEELFLPNEHFEQSNISQLQDMHS